MGRVNSSSRLALLRSAAPYFLLLALGFVFIQSAGRDDKYILFWAADTLASKGRILNYNGEAIEQSSSLLFVIVLAALKLLTRAETSLIGHLMSLVFGIMAIWHSGRLARRCNVAALPVQLMTAMSYHFMYWSFGGMEVTMAAWLNIAVIDLGGSALARERLSSRRLAVLALLGLAYLLARPEAPLVLLAALIACSLLVSVQRREISGVPHGMIQRRLWAAIGGTLALASAVAALRMHAFGEPLPHPAIAKIGEHSLDTLRGGFAYVMGAWVAPPAGDAGATRTVYHVWNFTPLLVLAVAWQAIRALNARRRPPAEGENLFELLALSLVAAQLAFLLSTGGDWMEGGRFLAPVIPLMCSIFCGWLHRLAGRRRSRLGIGAMLAFQAIALGCFVRTYSYGIPIWATSKATSWGFFERRNRLAERETLFAPVVWDRVNALLERGQNKVTILSAQAGLLMYKTATRFSPRIAYIDRLGLTTAHATSCALVRTRPRDAFGIRWRLEDYLEHKRRYADECGVPEPDLIVEFFVDLARVRPLLARHGYHIVDFRPPRPRDWWRSENERPVVGEYLAERGIEVER